MKAHTTTAFVQWYNVKTQSAGFTTDVSKMRVKVSASAFQIDVSLHTCRFNCSDFLWHVVFDVM